MSNALLSDTPKSSHTVKQAIYWLHANESYEVEELSKSTKAQPDNNGEFIWALVDYLELQFKSRLTRSMPLSFIRIGLISSTRKITLRDGTKTTTVGSVIRNTLLQGGVYGLAVIPKDLIDAELLLTFFNTGIRCKHTLDERNEDFWLKLSSIPRPVLLDALDINFCLKAIQASPLNIQWIFQMETEGFNVFNDNVWKMAIDTSAWIFYQNVEAELITSEMINYTLLKGGNSLNCIPESLRTKNIWLGSA